MRIKLKKMGLEPSEIQIEQIQTRIREILEHAEFVKESELEEIAREIVK